MKAKRSAKSQSAMEYLMTYGWAILIIAVVLGALFQLGVFSGIGTPKAQSGNCQIVKEGTGITQTISLAGQCQGQEPEYVAVFDNPLTSNYPSCPCNYVNINSVKNSPTGTASRSLFAWVYINSNYATDSDAQCAGVNWANCWYSVAKMGSGGGCYNTFDLLVYGVNGNGLGVGQDSACSGYESSLVIPLNSWHFIGLTYGANGANTITFYMDGQPSNDVSSFTVNTLGGGATSATSIGSNFDSSGGFPGSIANVQYYNTTLSQGEVTALYHEGIGGAPIRPQNVVGWWPLNGNAKDYSGNNNNGQIIGGVGYSSSWFSGYTTP